MLSSLINIFELATVVLLFLCVLKEFNKQSNDKEKNNSKKIFKKKKLTKEERKEQERLQTIIANIDNYTGDSVGQKEVK